MAEFTVFVVDDDDTIREGVEIALQGQYRIISLRSAEEMLQTLDGSHPDLILLDIGLPGMDGIQALEEIKKIHPETLVIMITAYEDVKSVIRSMKLGAYDYIVKPLHMEALEVSVKNALNTVRLKKEVRDLQEKSLREHVPCFIGESREIQNVMKFVHQVAQSPDTPVLVLGETGTGKELIVRTIHFRSPNFNGPLITVNCAAIPRELLESELFGYEKGAFSGARASGKKGLVEEADQGTLFLDEVGDLSTEAQAKLLRFLEAGEYYRVGGTRTLKVRTRVISATNKNLVEMIREGQFREDLYFRLSVIKLEIPSLRERREDIIHLSRFFLLEFNRKFGKSIEGFSPEAEKALLDHEWQGNVRELKNYIERACLMGPGPFLSAEDLSLTAKENTGSGTEQDTFSPVLTRDGADLPVILENVERMYIEEALTLADGNESKAARILNLNHHTFRYRRRKLERH